jgi:hypothetical protein
MTIRPRNPSLQNVKFIMVNKEMKHCSNGAHNFYAIKGLKGFSALNFGKYNHNSKF